MPAFAGSSSAPRNFPAYIPVRVLLCLFVLLLFRTTTAAADDKYALPKDDPCHDTLEGYKKYMAPRADDLLQVSYYRENAKAIEEWLQCCPGGKKLADRFRPKFPDTERPRSDTDIPMPPLFNKTIPCAKVIYSQGLFSFPLGQWWLVRYRSERDEYWKQQYFNVTNRLHDCCLLKLRAPQPLPVSDQPSDQEAERARLMQALVAYEYQLASVQKELDQYKEQAQRERDQCKVQARLELNQCKVQAQSAEEAFSAKIRQAADERDRTVRILKDKLEQATPYSGFAALAAFPMGAAAASLVLYGSLALLAGFLLAVPGHTRWWARLLYGQAGAVLALIVFVITVAFLPDTRTVHFLLALTVAILVSALRAWIRAFLLLSRSGQLSSP